MAARNPPNMSPTFVHTGSLLQALIDQRRKRSRVCNVYERTRANGARNLSQKDSKSGQSQVMTHKSDVPSILAPTQRLILKGATTQSVSSVDMAVAQLTRRGRHPLRITYYFGCSSVPAERSRTTSRSHLVPRDDSRVRGSYRAGFAEILSIVGSRDQAATACPASWSGAIWNNISTACYSPLMGHDVGRPEALRRESKTFGKIAIL